MNASYKKEFRAEAVRLAITGDKSISQTAKDLGVNETTLYNWVAKARESKVPHQDGDEIRSAADVIDELKQLRKENARLREEREILKKSRRVFREGGTKAMKYSFVRDEAKNHSVEQLCNIMEISRSSYYAFESKTLSKREEVDQHLIPIVQEIFKENRKAYGYRRISNELKGRGENCGYYKTASLMRKLNLKPVAKRRFKLTTDSKHSLPIFANVLNRNFKPSKMNQAWTSDITYIDTHQGWLYLAVVMDLYSRTVVGWAMDKNMATDLVKNALNMALSKRKVSTGLILHSDRGSQYASYEYQSLLKKHGIICSMSRRGNCWDNAPMESFFRSLKVECIYQQLFEQRDEAKTEIFSYIEGFYNRQRKHSALNYLSPREYELAYANL